MTRALIFDFDGVIADSEVLANSALADYLTCLGHPTTTEEALATYLGKRWPEVVATVEDRIGRKLPDNFSADLKAAVHERFARDLGEVEGARDFIHAFAHLPRAIASSSSADRLALCLDALELTDMFGANVFSADLVERGKPDPAIFLLAAEKLNTPPVHCIVIEDSAGGVRAGRAAGMTVIGLTAASHLPPGHAGRLRDAGAHHIARNWGEAHRIMTGLLNGSSP